MDNPLPLTWLQPLLWCTIQLTTALISRSLVKVLILFISLIPLVKACQPSSIREDGHTGSQLLYQTYWSHMHTSCSTCMGFPSHGHKSFCLLVYVHLCGLLIQENLYLEISQAFFGARTNKNLSREFPAVEEQKLRWTITKMFLSFCFRLGMAVKWCDLWRTLHPAPSWCKLCKCVFL